MICKPCIDEDHDDCEGATRCDCQHRTLVDQEILDNHPEIQDALRAADEGKVVQRPRYERVEPATGPVGE